MLKKKIIILSGNKYRGVLKLTLLENAYLNLDLTAHFLPRGDYMFFIMIGDQIEKFSFDGEKLTKRLNYPLNIDKDIECAAADFAPPYILMSATCKKELSTRLLNEIHTYMTKNTSKFDVKDTLTKNSGLEMNEISAKNAAHAIENNHDYAGIGKQADIAAEDSTNGQNEPLHNRMQKDDSSPFFTAIKSTLEDFFEKYPPYEPLTAIVPSSKWVRVDTEDTFYVVGLLYNTSGVTHICYGIPGEYTVKPVSETLTEWLPLNPEEWEKEGFWMIYQNAETGQI